MTTTAMLIEENESLPEEHVAEAPKSMFGAFPGISTDVEREEEDRV
jgi:hypothetical protein